MYIKVWNLRLEKRTNEFELEVPTDLQPVKEWLEDYEQHNPTDEQALETYIRTWLLNNDALMYDFIFVKEQEVSNQDQPWNLDALDHTYAEYKKITIRITLPTEFVCNISDDYISMWQPFMNDAEPTLGADQLHMIMYDYMNHNLPIEIEIL